MDKFVPQVAVITETQQRKSALYECFQAMAKGETVRLAKADEYLRLYVRPDFMPEFFGYKDFNAFAARLDNVFNGQSDPHDETLADLAGEKFALGGFKSVGAGVETERGQPLLYIDVVPDRLEERESFKTRTAKERRAVLDNLADHPFLRQQARSEGIVKVKTSTGFKVKF